MSDNYGFDFNNDGKVSFEESHLTYHIERETARNNSGNYSPRRTSTRRSTSDNKDKTEYNESDYKKGLALFIGIVLILIIDVVYIIVRLNS